MWRCGMGRNVCSVVCNMRCTVFLLKMQYSTYEFNRSFFRDILGEDPTLSGLDSSMNDEVEDAEDAWNQKEDEEACLEVGYGQSAPKEATLLYQARMAGLFLDIMYWDIVQGITCTCTDLPNIAHVHICLQAYQLDEGKYDLCHLFALYKDAEYDRSSHSLCLCTKGYG